MTPSGQPTDVPPFVQLAAHSLRWRLLTELAASDYRVRELAARVDEPQNLVSYHLRLLRDGGFVTATRSSFDGRDSYYHLDLDRCAKALADSGSALHPALRHDAEPLTPLLDQPRARRPTVLFVCTGNSVRSPTAEALLRRRAAGAVTVTSAGSRPAPRIHPNAVRVLREEFDIDVADQCPRHLDSAAARSFDYVITLCDKAREVCPEFGRDSRRAHWSVPEPVTADDSHQASYPAFRRTAVAVDARVRHLLPVIAATRHKEG